MTLVKWISNFIISIALINGLCILRNTQFKKKRNFIYITIVTLNCILNYYIEKMIIMIIMLWIIIYEINTYEDIKMGGYANKRKNFLTTFVIICIFLISDIISNLIINFIFNAKMNLVYNIINVVFNCLFIYSMSKIFSIIINDYDVIKYRCSIKKHNSRHIYIWMNIFLCLLIVILNFILNKKIGISDTKIYLSNLILFSSAILSSIFSAYVFNKFSLKELEVEIKAEEIKNIEEYAKHVEELYENIRVFKHDYKNILMSINEYIEEDKYEELEIYFKEYILPTEKYIEKSDFLVKLKNLEILPLKSVIISKFMRAHNEHMNIFIDIGEKIDNISMDYMDSIRVLGILLDNAMEEAAKTKDKKINFGIIKKGNSIIFIIENSCTDNVSNIYKLYEKGFSTKGNHRGLGLYNLKNIINKYSNVTFNMESKNNLFNTELWIRNLKS